jgi:hypothetical protein
MWFKKKESDRVSRTQIPELPELPELPDLPELPQMPPAANQMQAVNQVQKINTERDDFSVIIKDELPVLPTFSNSDVSERISRNMIKSALSVEQPRQYIKETPQINKEEPRRFVEKSERRTLEIPSRPAVKERQPVYVRIDKFQEAVRNLEEIKRKLMEIEDYLSKIKEIKTKEEHELGEWEKEILELKSKLELIDSGVFSKVD